MQETLHPFLGCPPQPHHQEAFLHGTAGRTTKSTKSSVRVCPHDVCLLGSNNIFFVQEKYSSMYVCMYVCMVITTDVSSIPENGIFLTKKLKTKNKNAQRVEND